MSRLRASLRRFVRQTKASASVEFALLVPLLVVLLFGGSEAGHFVWTQHKLAEGVRDGARYASRLPVLGSGGVCDGATETISNEQIDNIRLITRTGQLANAGAMARVPGWTAAQVTVTVNCQAYVDTGIYTDLGEAGPVVTVAASNVPYPSLFGGLVGLSPAVRLSSESNAVVIGI